MPKPNFRYLMSYLKNFSVVFMQYKVPNLLKMCSICCNLCFFLLMAYSTATGFTVTANEFERPPVAQDAKTPPLVSMSIENMSIEHAISLIEKKTDYHIELQSIDSTETVSGQFIETDIETVCINLLKKYNLAVLIDTRNRLMTVKSVGPKIDARKSAHSVDGVVATGASEQISLKDGEGDERPLGSESISDQREPVTGMTSSELVTLHQKQAAEIEREQQNPESVLPFSGISNATIRALHEEQEKALVDTRP